jgi:hypothetical protein
MKKRLYSPLRVKVAVLTPITWPCESINGPPELPVKIPSKKLENHLINTICSSVTMADSETKNNIRSHEGSSNENETLFIFQKASTMSSQLRVRTYLPEITP